MVGGGEPSEKIVNPMPKSTSYDEYRRTASLQKTSSEHEYFYFHLIQLVRRATFFPPIYARRVDEDFFSRKHCAPSSQQTVISFNRMASISTRRTENKWNKNNKISPLSEG